MTRMLSGHPAGMVMPPPPKLEAPGLWAGAATNTAFSGPTCKRVLPLESLVPDPVIAQAAPPGGAPAGAEGN
jgi:hypothetical protein